MFDADPYFVEEITLSYNLDEVDANTDEVTSSKLVEITITEDDLLFLPAVLEKVKDFLQSAGFSYIEAITVTTMNGGEFSA